MSDEIKNDEAILEIDDAENKVDVTSDAEIVEPEADMAMTAEEMPVADAPSVDAVTGLNSQKDLDELLALVKQLVARQGTEYEREAKQMFPILR
jgi:hypothetical protein